MSTLTKEKAWEIFRADKLGQPEAKKSLLGADWGTYHLYADDFELKLAQIGVEAQNEGAAIWEAKLPEVGHLDVKPQHTWTAADYQQLVGIFEGSKFETLHLSAMFRVPNGELLLELVKP